MTKDEFTKVALKCGYGCQKTIEKYTEGRNEFTQEDFVKLFRVCQPVAEAQKNSKWRNYEGILTTKRLINLGNDKEW